MFNWQKPAGSAPEGEPPRRKRRVRIRLGSLDDIAAELRRLHRLVECGEITGLEAVRQTRVLNSLGQVLTASAVEKRLRAVELENARRRR